MAETSRPLDGSHPLGAHLSSAHEGLWFRIMAIRPDIRTDAEISDAVCWNEQGGMSLVWRSQMLHLFLRVSLHYSCRFPSHQKILLILYVLRTRPVRIGLAKRHEPPI